LDRWLSLCDSTKRDQIAGLSSTSLSASGKKSSQIIVNSTNLTLYDFDLEGAIGVDLMKTGMYMNLCNAGMYLLFQIYCIRLPKQYRNKW